MTMESKEKDIWAGGSSYEYFMGRWSRLIASSFLKWLAPRAGLDWLEIGCGTGALSETILTQAAPASLLGIDPSPEFIQFARLKLTDPRVVFQVGNALDLPVFPHLFDVVASGLAMNFISDPVPVLRALRGVLRPDGLLAFYVWDYDGKMELLSYFWGSVTALNPGASAYVEGQRFAICHPDILKNICEQAALRSIEVAGIDIEMAFPDFNDYWSPFLGGAGPAPSYVARLDEHGRKALEEHLRGRLPLKEDGSINLAARAWAVRAYL